MRIWLHIRRSKLSKGFIRHLSASDPRSMYLQMPCDSLMIYIKPVRAGYPPLHTRLLPYIFGPSIYMPLFQRYAFAFRPEQSSLIEPVSSTLEVTSSWPCCPLSPVYVLRYILICAVTLLVFVLTDVWLNTRIFSYCKKAGFTAWRELMRTSSLHIYMSMAVWLEGFETG